MKKNGVDYGIVHARIPLALKNKVDKKVAKLGCSQTLIVRRLLEEWVAGDLFKSETCDTFLLNR